MKITEIYQKYTIMPSLQLHMLRVAGVGKCLVRSLSLPVNEKDIVTVCLLHDMGNIIKFNLTLFPEFFKPEGVEYWKKVQNEYIAKYGSNEHDATLQIAKEIGVTDRVFEMLESVSFSKAKDIYASSDMEKKIVFYSDMRVEPHGVVSLESRLIDGSNRFNLNKTGEERTEFFEEMASHLRKIEDQIFSKSEIRPENITDAVVNQEIESLKNFEL